MEPMTMTATALGTLLLMKIGEGAATEAGKQVFEKVKSLLTPQLKEKATELLRLLRLKSPQTAKAIEKAPNPPLNIDVTENELKQAIENELKQGITEHSQLAEVVEEIDAVVKADPKLMQVVKQVIDDLKSQPSGKHSYTNIAEKIVNLAQGNGIIHIDNQTIN